MRAQKKHLRLTNKSSFPLFSFSVNRFVLRQFWRDESADFLQCFSRNENRLKHYLFHPSQPGNLRSIIYATPGQDGGIVPPLAELAEWAIWRNEHAVFLHRHFSSFSNESDDHYYRDYKPPHIEIPSVCSLRRKKELFVSPTAQEYEWARMDRSCSRELDFGFVCSQREGSIFDAEIRIFLEIEEEGSGDVFDGSDLDPECVDLVMKCDKGRLIPMDSGTAFGPTEAFVQNSFVLNERGPLRFNNILPWFQHWRRVPRPEEDNLEKEALAKLHHNRPMDVFRWQFSSDLPPTADILRSKISDFLARTPPERLKKAKQAHLVMSMQFLQCGIESSVSGGGRCSSRFVVDGPCLLQCDLPPSQPGLFLEGAEKVFCQDLAPTLQYFRRRWFEKRVLSWQRTEKRLRERGGTGKKGEKFVRYFDMKKDPEFHCHMRMHGINELKRAMDGELRHPEQENSSALIRETLQLNGMFHSEKEAVCLLDRVADLSSIHIYRGPARNSVPPVFPRAHPVLLHGFVDSAHQSFLTVFTVKMENLEKNNCVVSCNSRYYHHGTSYRRIFP